VKVAFVYPNSRSEVVDRIARGEAPDTTLLGQNHLQALGIDATIHNPALRRRDRRSGLLHRITWNAREVALPWELRGIDVACTPLARAFPLMARLRRGPRVLLVSYHLCATYERSTPVARRLLQASIRSAAAVVCVSEEGARRLIELVGVDGTRVHVAQLGVDERFWAATPPAPDGYVLTVGRDLARDYATFAAAIAELPVKAILVAKRENLAGIELPPNVEVRLDIGPDEVRSLYAGAACVVVPIRGDGHVYGTENSGTIALLEAMATGRPTIVTDRATLRDYVRPGESALAVPAEDAGALRESVARVLGDPALAATLGASARRAVDERFTTRALARRLARVIDGLDR
jgi:glycosyltransferase involved in cell wall biosynthesis